MFPMKGRSPSHYWAVLKNRYFRPWDMPFQDSMNMCHHLMSYLASLLILVMLRCLHFVFCEKGDKSANERSAWFDYTASMIEVAQAEVTQASLLSIPF